MSKVITAREAALLIGDGATVAASTQGLSGWAEEIALAVEDRFLESGHPKNITLVHACTCGDYKSRGTTHLGHEGLVKRLICGHTLTSPRMIDLIERNKIECYLLPQGVICQMWRAIAGHKVGVITSVGLGTYVDPRLEGGKITSITEEDMVSLIEVAGREQLFYKPFPVDVALIRGTVADENGNLTMDNESVLLEALPLAMAAKNSGGIVLAQAQSLSMNHSLHPKRVRVPGTLVDHVVIAKPENHMQTQKTQMNPALAGHIKVPMDIIPAVPFDVRKVIARRAAMELRPGYVINLGVGIPDKIAVTVVEEGMSHAITITTELGVFGGVPANGLDFGGAYNADAMIEHSSMFDYYEGGGLDVAFVGLAQVDRNGNVNVSRFGSKVAGPGGFINITQNSKKVVFCGMFTTGSEEVLENGELRITKIGQGRKFVAEVDQVTFSGAFAMRKGTPVLFITERGVFTLDNGQLVLVEIAPGIHLEKDILDMMDFKPRVSEKLRVMEPAIFKPVWGGLGACIQAAGGEGADNYQMSKALAG
ncbi:MAG: acyl CoA:acetate/3-ketoacid CoA transferase [Acidobacteria bacterium]|nr:acyl CoA:acetate/3-ketoacid CoA transferase [Acidobacteriota bacterium]